MRENRSADIIPSVHKPLCRQLVSQEQAMKRQLSPRSGDNDNNCLQNNDWLLHSQSLKRAWLRLITHCFEIYNYSKTGVLKGCAPKLHGCPQKWNITSWKYEHISRLSVQGIRLLVCLYWGPELEFQCHQGDNCGAKWWYFRGSPVSPYFI